MAANVTSPVSPVACAPGWSEQKRRRAIVLLIVITLLALFAAVALGFVYYANSEARSATVNKEAATMRKIDMDPELLLSQILGPLIYDKGDLLAAGNDTTAFSPTTPSGLYS